MADFDDRWPISMIDYRWLFDCPIPDCRFAMM